MFNSVLMLIRMRVCIFGSEIGPAKNKVFVGGVAVNAIRLAKALYALGDEVFVFSSAPRGKPSKIYTFDWGVVVNKRIPGRYTSLPYMVLYGLVSFFGLLRFCKRNKIEVINSHSGYVILCAIPSVVGKVLRVPVVHTQYCALSSWHVSLGESLGRFVTKVCLSLPAMFSAISNNVHASLIQAGLSDRKVEVIPPAVPSSEKGASHEAQYRKFLRIDEDDLVVLFVGNLKKNKGVDVLFEAVSRLADVCPKLRLIVTTELMHESFWERRRSLQDWLSRHGLTDRVVWLGVVDDMLHLIREVDVVVVPFLNLKGISDYPLVVLEAMSVGTSVIASNVGGIREILQDKETGILVPPGDIEALCKALKEIITSEELKHRLMDSVRKYSLDSYAPEAVGQKYRKLFSTRS